MENYGYIVTTRTFNSGRIEIHYGRGFESDRKAPAHTALFDEAQTFFGSDAEAVQFMADTRKQAASCLK